jgi:hypothetical protein
MITPLLTLGLSLCLGQVPEPVEGIASKLSLTILRNRYPRVGVVPCFIQREGEKESWGGRMGPQGEWLAEALTEALESQAKGKFVVVNHVEMAKAFRDLKLAPSALAEPGVLKKIAQRGGIDALVVGRAVDVREPARPGATAGRLVRSNLTCNLLDLHTVELVASANRDLAIVPSLAAYRGESPATGGYSPIVDTPGVLGGGGDKGVNTPNLAPASPNLVGANATRQDGAVATPDGAEVPALDDPRCLFPMQIVVDDAARNLIKLNNPVTGRAEYFVNLEPGETFQIVVPNKTSKTVYAAVYVDGINILGVRRDPDDPRVWNMAPGKEARFRGWYIGAAGDYKEKPLIIRPASDSIAVQIGGGEDGFADRIGEIQCIFFGTEDDPKLATGEKSMMLGRVGTGGGEARAIKLSEIQGPKRSESRMLSYVIHYAPMSQIAKRQTVKD